MALGIFTYFCVTELQVFDKLGCGCISSFGWLRRSLWFLVAPHILSTQLFFMLSWFSGHFITSWGPFKLISLFPLVGELGNTIPGDGREPWMPWMQGGCVRAGDGHFVLQLSSVSKMWHGHSLASDLSYTQFIEHCSREAEHYLESCNYHGLKLCFYQSSGSW